MTTPVYTINTPFLNYFLHNAGPNIGKPLVGGKIYFYSDAGFSIPADTYSDIADPNNPVVNTNPIELGSVGECPVIYLKNIPYYVQIYDSVGKPAGQLIKSYEKYRGGAFTGSPSPGPGPDPDPSPNDGFSGNLIANGQFNYPVEFSLDGTGQVTDMVTDVALGWQFICDDTSSNKITFSDVSNQQIEGNPQNSIVITSSGAVGEERKEIAAVYGAVDAFTEEYITISFQGLNLSAGTSLVSLILYQNFGEGGDPDVYTDLGTFTLTQARQKFYTTTTPPSTTGKTIGPANYASILIQYPLGSSCSIDITNALVQIGVFDPPFYYSVSNADEKSQIMGAITQLNPLGFNQEGYPLTYTQGNIIPYSNTGKQFFSVPGLLDSFSLKCDGSSLKVSDSTNGIPNERLYSVIGNTYTESGEGGDLIVSSSENIISFTTFVGAKEKTAYSAGTTGFSINNPTQALLCGVSAALQTPNTVRVTFTSNFEVNQARNNTTPTGTVGAPPASPIGSLFERPAVVYDTTAGFPAANQAIQSVIVAPGSVSTPGIVDLVFTKDSPVDYRTYCTTRTYRSGSTNNGRTYQYNTLDFPTAANNVSHGNYSYNYNGNTNTPTNLSPIAVLFSVNGTVDSTLGGGTQRTVTVPFLTANTLRQNIQTFMRSVANPFVWTVTVNAAPAASQYFNYSSPSTDYYAWYKVDGTGTDPAIPSRTGVLVNILSTDTPAAVAQKTAEALNSLQFNLPPSQTLEDEVSVNYIYL